MTHDSNGCGCCGCRILGNWAFSIHLSVRGEKEECGYHPERMSADGSPGDHGALGSCTGGTCLWLPLDTTALKLLMEIKRSQWHGSGEVRSPCLCVQRALTLDLWEKHYTLSMALVRRESVTAATAAIWAAGDWDILLALPRFCSITSGKLLKTVIDFRSLGFWMPSSNNLGSDFQRCLATGVFTDHDWYLGLGTSDT